VILLFQNDPLRYLKKFRLLLRNDIDVNRKNSYGNDALRYLFQYYIRDDLLAIMQLLIDHWIEFNRIPQIKKVEALSQ
jgi:hypothetical protein